MSERAPSPEPKAGDVWMVALKDEHPCIKKGHRYVVESRDDLGFAVTCGCDKPAFAPPEVFLAAAEASPTATLRDQFAMAALGGILANEAATRKITDDAASKRRRFGPYLAETAYLFADAMLEARKAGG